MVKVIRYYINLRSALFFAWDGFLIFISVPLAILIRFQLDKHYILTDQLVVSKALLFTSICQVCLFYNDLYTLKNSVYKQELPKRFLQAIAASGVILTGISFLFPDVLIGRGIFLTSLTICPIFLISWRYLYGLLLENSILNDRILLIGSGALAKEIGNEIASNKSLGYYIAASVDEEFINKVDPTGVGDKTARNQNRISRIVREEKIDQIIVAMSERRNMLPVDDLLTCKMQGVEIEDGVSFLEKVTGKVDLDELKPSWLIYSDGFKINKLTKIMKRTLDIVLSFTGLVLSIPFFLFIPLMIRLDSRGPIFFRQERVGENDVSFTLIKFRSMRLDAEKSTGPVWAQKNDPRVTRLGNFMRRTRIDEIPQLFNVLKGEMSFVGPRPERPSFVQQLNQEIPYYSLRHSVKPGITGWAQIKYPYGASVRDSYEKLKYDLFYIKNVSFYLDWAIVLSTIRVVLSARGSR